MTPQRASYRHHLHTPQLALNHAQAATTDIQGTKTTRLALVRGAHCVASYARPTASGRRSVPEDKTVLTNLAYSLPTKDYDPIAVLSAKRLDTRQMQLGFLYVLP